MKCRKREIDNAKTIFNGIRVYDEYSRHANAAILHSNLKILPSLPFTWLHATEEMHLPNS